MDSNFLRRRSAKYESGRSAPSHTVGGVVRPGSFRPPEAVAEQEDAETSSSPASSAEGSAGHNTSATQPPKHRRNFKEWLKGITKKQWIIIGIIAVLVLGGGGFALY